MFEKKLLLKMLTYSQRNLPAGLQLSLNMRSSSEETKLQMNIKQIENKKLLPTACLNRLNLADAINAFEVAKANKRFRKTRRGSMAAQMSHEQQSASGPLLVLLPSPLSRVDGSWCVERVIFGPRSRQSAVTARRRRKEGCVGRGTW